MEPYEPSDYDKAATMYIAIVVRNAMERFHDELTDQQMKSFNIAIRNAIYTALYTMTHYRDSDAAKAFVDHQSSMIPRYWEMPVLLDDYVRTQAKFHGGTCEHGVGTSMPPPRGE